MTVKITLEFPNAETAVLALGKLIGGRAARAARTPVPSLAGADVNAPEGAAGVTPQGPVTSEPATPSGRKPRNDAGKPRGPRAQKAGASGSNAPSASEPTAGGATGGDTPSVGTPAAVPIASVAPASTEVPTVEQAQAVLERFFNAQPTPEVAVQRAKDEFAKFGVARLREVPAEKRAEFMAGLEAAIAKVKA